jgi:hypothetical protein
MDKQTWQFINTFAPWLSAIGTISAVFVSLYLATQDRRVRLKISASVQVLVQNGHSEEFVGISAVNVGRRELTITGIGWKMGIFRKRGFFQLGFSHHSTPLPTRLEDGETAIFLIPLENTEMHWVSGMRDELGKLPWLKVYFMKAHVVTSIGKTFTVRVDRNIRNLLTGKKDKQVGV